jgi:hypothetical protein
MVEEIKIGSCRGRDEDMSKQEDGKGTVALESHFGNC